MEVGEFEGVGKASLSVPLEQRGRTQYSQYHCYSPRLVTVKRTSTGGVRNTSRGRCKKCKEVQRGVSVGRYIA